MAAAEWKGKRAPTEVTLDYFGKMLEEPCPNHGYPIKHTLKDCGLMRKFLAGGSRKEEPREPDLKDDDAKGEDGASPTTFI